MIVQTDGDFDLACQRAEYYRQVAGAIAIHHYYEQYADQDIGLIFEFEGFKQRVFYRIPPHRFGDDNFRARLIKGLQSMYSHAIYLIYLDQIPDGFDRWQSEGGK